MYIHGNGGVQNDSTYPYEEGVRHSRVYPCRYNGANKVATATGYWRIHPFNATLLRSIVSCKGPVVAAMTASLDSFYFYSSGVYNDANCKIGSSHSVLIVGYGTQNGQVSADPIHNFKLPSRKRRNYFLSCLFLGSLTL